MYILIGLLFGFGIIWHSDYPTILGPDFLLKWLPNLGNAAYIFGYIISAQRASVNRPLFWLLLCALFAIHILFFLWAYEHFGRWPLIYWVFISPVEFAIITAILHKFDFHGQYSRRKNNEQ